MTTVLTAAEFIARKKWRTASGNLIATLEYEQYCWLRWFAKKNKADMAICKASYEHDVSAFYLNVDVGIDVRSGEVTVNRSNGKPRYECAQCGEGTVITTEMFEELEAGV